MNSWVAVALSVGFFSLSNAGCQMPTGAAKTPDRAYLHAQLVEYGRHNEDDSVHIYHDSHLTQNIPEGFWLAVFPPDVSWQRLLSRGKTLIVPDAKLIAEDTSEDEAMRAAAAKLYGYFDEPWYLQWLANGTYTTERSQTELWVALRGLLPTTPDELTLHTDLTQEWLRRELATRPNFGEVVLKQFDAVMIPDLTPQKDGLIEQDPRLVKWFNRLDDMDLDAWLTDHAPKSLEYRQHTWRDTGVDPLTAYVDNGSDALRRAILFRVLPGADAQKCLDLVNAVFPSGSYGQYLPQSDAKWRERICAWYWTHRKEFRYDRELRRFVLPIS